MRRRPSLLMVTRVNTWGGTLTGLRGILRRLDRARYDPHLAILSPQQRHLDFFRCRGLTLHSIEAAHPVEQLTRLIRRKKMALVQTCDGSAAAARAARDCGVPHLWFVGGPLDETHHPKRILMGADQRFPETLRHVIDLLSDAIVVPSRFVASTVFRDVPHAKLRVIPLGIDVDRLSAAPLPMPHEPKGPRIALVANFNPLKRHLDFLEAARLIRDRLPQARFSVAGRCSMRPAVFRRITAQWRAQVLRRIQALGLNGSLTITSFDPGQPEAFFSKIDLLISCSIEAFGQAVGEAMATGRPVVAVREGGTGELIQNERSGLLVPFGNPDALARAALRVLWSKSLAVRLGQGARERISGKFTSERQAGRFQKLYDRLLR